MDKVIFVNGKQYTIIKLLGKGKSGYSYLGQINSEKYVIKKMHHEPCDYYTFTNKIESEIRDYHTLCKQDILLPQLIEVDYENEIIVKEFIDGKTIFELIVKDEPLSIYYSQIILVSEALKKHNLNIDYFPTNFIAKGQQLYYIDYECNPYLEEWSFENWGIKYWSKTKEFLEHLKALQE